MTSSKKNPASAGFFFLLHAAAEKALAAK